MPDDPQELPRGVSVTRRRQAPPWHLDAGAPDQASLHVVVQGSFRLTRSELPAVALEAGDIVLIEAGDPDAGGSALGLCCVAPPLAAARPEPAELLSAAYAPVTARAGAPDAPAPVVRLSATDVGRDGGLSAVVSLLRAALVNPGAERERLALSLLAPLLAYVLDCHERVRAAELAGDAAPAVDERVARALQRMRSTPAERWTVAKLARAASLSRAAFARRFLSEVGVPPLRYLAELRMELASRLLAEGDDALASVAAQVGYDSEFAFSRAFKRHTGEAPGAFRRLRRSGGAAFRLPPTRAAA